MEEDISICIPAKNRPEKLKILFLFLNKFDYKGKLLIADASDKSLKIELENFLKNLKPKFKFRHIRAKNTPVLESILMLSKEVTTPFTMIIGDDDFMIFPRVRIDWYEHGLCCICPFL